MYEFTQFLYCLTLILFSACCAVYLTKEVMFGFVKFIKDLVSELEKEEDRKM